MEHWGWRIPFLLVAPIGAFILSKLSGKVLHGAGSSAAADQVNNGGDDHDDEALKGRSMPSLFFLLIIIFCLETPARRFLFLWWLLDFLRFRRRRGFRR